MKLTVKTIELQEFTSPLSPSKDAPFSELAINCPMCINFKGYISYSNPIEYRCSILQTSRIFKSINTWCSGFQQDINKYKVLIK